jgi:hypothetical protein
MRERFDGTGRVVSVADLDLVLVELSGTAQVLDLRRDRILDALGLDDQISTSRAPDVWRAGQLLADRIDAWFGPRCHGLVYRSRTTPEASANLAFRASAPLAARSLGRLAGHRGLLASCVVSDGFTVQDWPESG